MSNYNFDNIRGEKKIKFDNERGTRAEKSSFMFDNERNESYKKDQNHITAKKEMSSDTDRNYSKKKESDFERFNDKYKTSFSKKDTTEKNSGISKGFLAVVGTILILVVFLCMVISIIRINRHDSHQKHMVELLDDNKVADAVEYYNKQMFKDITCQENCLFSLRSQAFDVFSSYINQQILYEEAIKNLQILVEINDDNVSSEINVLLHDIEQMEIAKQNENNIKVDEKEADTGEVRENENEIIQDVYYLEDCAILDFDEYQGNLGDSFIYPIGKHQYTRGQCDIYGEKYTHGIEAWIARWNYEDEISWAYSVFELPENMNSLTGKVVLIDSYNTNDFDSTLYFIDADNDIEVISYHLTPDDIPFNFSVSVLGIQKLKILVKDNRAVSGGTSFGLINAMLSKNKLDENNNVYHHEIDREIELLIPSDAYVWRNHSYYIYSNADTWMEAEEYCLSHGGYLAVITSKEENDAVYKYLKNKNIDNAYFGLTDKDAEGVWKWADGTKKDYTNWHTPAEPNAENSNEDYAMFYYKYPDGTWNDGDFGEHTINGGKNYICEWDGF